MGRILAILAVVLVVTALVAQNRLSPIARVGAGYKAKIACSEIFVAGRTEADVVASEFDGIDDALQYISLAIDRSARTAQASLGPIGRARAAYREGYGCTLTKGPLADLPPLEQPPAQAWREATAAEAGFDVANLNGALDQAMGDAAAGHRAFLVAVDDAVIAERYADGFSSDTPMLSWSMGKSVTATMIGIAVKDGLIDINETPPIQEWLGDGDPRSAITWRDLLRMQSGLEFVEDYGDPTSTVNQMLFNAAEVAKPAIESALKHEPDQHWSYSSGTTNLLQKALKTTLESAGVNYHSFARDRLFAPLGASSAVLEPDSSGVFIGSSYMYATARDWAKLGRLYLNDGVWNGERLLPEGWAKFVATPSGQSDRQYGAQFWLNAEGRNGRPRFMPGLPDSAYYFAGHEGQYVVILPDDGMVLVRLGRTRGASPIKVAGDVFADIFAARANVATAQGGSADSGTTDTGAMPE